MTLLPIDEAQRIVLDGLEPLEAESIAVAEASGRVLAEPLLARWDQPRAPVSIMDGYAVRAADLRPDGEDRTCALRLAGESAAGHPMTAALGPGEVARISTGAVVPTGADVVVPQEDTRREDDAVIVDLAAFGDVHPGRWIRPTGADFRMDEVVLPVGAWLGPAEVALAAAAGHTSVRVHRRPVVATAGTGDELVPVGRDPGPGRVVSTNGIMLRHQIERTGGVPNDLGDAPDDPRALSRTLARGMTADVLVISGGISVGEHDLVYDALLELGCTFAFRGVSLRPGKPLAFGRTGSTLVFALPGNPASTFVCFELFVRPALRRLLGIRSATPVPWVEVELAAPARGAGSREHLVRARLGPDGRTATPLPDQRSGNLRSLAGCDVLVRIPAGQGDVPRGARARALVLDPWWNERIPS